MVNKLPLAYVELSKKNLIQNIKALRSVAKKNTKISVAIKGNAYGHGQNEVATILEPYVDYFLVNSVSELSLLRKVSKKKTFIIGYIAENEIKEIIGQNAVPTVFNLRQLRTLNQVAKKARKTNEINLAIDAHLGREGFLLEELPEILNEIKKSKNLKLLGAYSHFANVEDTSNFSHASKQIKKYYQALKILEKEGYSDIQTHISSTSGLLVYERGKGIHPVVRLGIGVYGLWPSEYIKGAYKFKMKLKPVLSWKTKIAQIKILPKGHTIGYGLSYRTTGPTKIAVIPQGYADGYDRGLSNKGEVLIGGTRCPILGRVSMNMIVADVSHLKNVKAEEEVVLLGWQKRPAFAKGFNEAKEEISPEELAQKLDTINYEIVTRVSALLPRVVK